MGADSRDENLTAEPARHSWLWNEDLAPIPLGRRTWGTYNYAALWVAMSVNIPTYMLASGMIAGGMNWKQAIFTVFLGNLIVLVPMLLNAHAGARYGIPFPVFARSSFGVLGGEYSGGFAGACGLRMVWNSDLDWRRGYQYFAGGVDAFVESSLDLLFSFLVAESCGDFARD